MRKVLLIVVLAVAATGCTKAQVAAWIASHSPTPAAAAPAEAPPATVDSRIPGGWYLYGRDDTSICSSLHGTAGIPCRDVLNVCNDVDGVEVDSLMPATYYCTEQSPHRADVCRTVDPTEWAWYGLDPAACAQV